MLYKHFDILFWKTSSSAVRKCQVFKFLEEEEKRKFLASEHSDDFSVMALTLDTQAWGIEDMGRHAIHV